MSEMSAKPELGVAAETTGLGSSKFTYCGECGTWDAHGASCASCGYTFSLEPWRPAQGGDDADRARGSFG